jgi:hypothetical protein
MQDAMHWMRVKPESKHPFYETKATTLVLLHFVTLGFYGHYWHYKNWRIIQQNSGDLTLSPILRGIFFPFFIIPLVSVIKGSAEISGLKQGVARTSFAVVYLILSLAGLDIDHPYYVLLLIASFLPMYLLQRKNSEINNQFLENQTDSASNKTGAHFIEAQQARAGQISRRRWNYRDFILPYKFTIEVSTFVIVMLAGVAFALHDAERAYAKTKLVDILSSLSAAKTEVAETYAYTGIWLEKDLSYLFGDSGSQLVQRISSTPGGSIHYELSESAPFRQGDILSFTIKESEYVGPMHINSWECNSRNGPADNKTTLIEDYLPSICRG